MKIDARTETLSLEGTDDIEAAFERLLAGKFGDAKFTATVDFYIDENGVVTPSVHLHPDSLVGSLKWKAFAAELS